MAEVNIYVALTQMRDGDEQWVGAVSDNDYGKKTRKVAGAQLSPK